MKITKKILKSNAFQNIVCKIAHIYIRFVFLTSRWEVEGQEHMDKLEKSGKPFIIAFWHGRLLMIPPFAPHKRNIHVLISKHNDGELIARVMQHFKFSLIRGSTKKDAVTAFKNILRALKKGDVVAITPDGPKGPRMRIGGNIIKIAQMTNVPIIATSFSISNAKSLRSWDRFLVAKPFGKGVFIFDEPFTVAKGLKGEDLKKAGIDLEKRLNNITHKADKLAGVSPVEPDMI